VFAAEKILLESNAAVQPKLKILESMEQPLVDGFVLTLTCVAMLPTPSADTNMKWSGGSLDQHSIWLHQPRVTKQSRLTITRKLTFRPLLSRHAGNYTCHLHLNDLVITKTINVPGMSIIYIANILKIRKKR